MPLLAELIEHLERLAPLDIAEDWDNVGLLVGDRQQSVGSIMTCLTLTPDVAAEAIREEAGLIVSHHPILFRAVKRLTRDTVEGGMLLDLLQAGIAVYSPHTGYDSAAEGINRQLAESLGLQNVQPLRIVSEPDGDGVTRGAGRYGDLAEPCTLQDLVTAVKQALGIQHLLFVGDPARTVARVAVACGAAAEFLDDAAQVECQAFLTGEARFHDCLKARSEGIAMILPGHYATERPAMEQLAMRLARSFPKLRVWASRDESDPVQWS